LEEDMLRRWIVAALAISALAASDARADGVADFYKGKQVQIVVGYGPGGGYDLYAQLLSRHIGRHIPGNPSVVVQNMPGDGSMRAVNYLYSVAPKDGTVFGTFARSMPLHAILGGSSVDRIDPRKLNWLGSSSSYEDDAYLLVVRADAGVKSIEDLRKPGGPKLVLGGTGEGSSANDVPVLLRDTLDLNIELVTGYRDSNALFTAIEQGEIDGRTSDLASLRSNRPKWLEPGSDMRVLLQFARYTRHPDFPKVPTARELAKSGKARALIGMAELPYLMSRPFAAPPGVPADRIKALQAAFLAAHKDPQLVEEAAKLKLGISAVGGDHIRGLIEEISDSPPEVLDYMRKLQDASKG
jgi:tripartite-type tricarboxylate transporter receptor subunit TctC